MPAEPAPTLPEVRRVKPGDTWLLCRCGRSPALPDCPATCLAGLALEPVRERLLVLCRCGRSSRLPYCDGSHAPSAPTFKAKWRRFWGLSAGSQKCLRRLNTPANRQSNAESVTGATTAE